MFNEQFVKYDELGYKVVPIRPGSKHPGIENWETIEFREGTMFRGWGIGIRCGPSSGIVAIDIDKEEALCKCPLSLVVKKGKKGETRFFKYNGELPRKRHDLGIELFSGDRCQTVLPPSIHPETGKPYTWLTVDTLLNIDPNDLTTIPKEFIAFLDASMIEQQPAGGRHNKLIDMALAMHAKGKGIAVIAQELFDYDLKNNNPSYFLDTTEGHGGKGLDSATKMAISTASTAIQRKLQPPTQVTIGTQAAIEEMDEPEYDDQLLDLPHCEGLMKDIFDYVYANSPIPRSRFAWASSISLMSILVGNRYSFLNTHANIYSLLLAPTGFGKDAPLSGVNDILSRCDLTNFIGQSEYASDVGIVASFPDQRKRIDCIDEAALLFRSSERLPPTRQNIIHTLSKIWSGVGKQYEGRTRQKDLDEGKTAYKGRCFSPFLTLFAAMTFNGLGDNFDSSVLETGIGGRCLYFPEERFKQKKKRIKRIKMSDAMKHRIELWAPPKIVVSNPLARFEIKDLGPTDEDYYGQLWDKLATIEEQNQHNMAAPIYQRAIEQWHKQILIHHCSKSAVVAETVDNDSLDWAFKAIITTLNYGDYTINKFTCQTELAKMANRFYDIILQAKEAGLTHTKLYKRMQRYIENGNQLRDIMASLQHSNRITATKIISSGRTAILYTATKYSKMMPALNDTLNDTGVY